MVLVSSAGTIMPFLRKLSAANRACICEVGDVTEEEAFNYLVENGVTPTTAKEFVKCVGGRLIYLQNLLH